MVALHIHHVSIIIIMIIDNKSASDGLSISSLIGVVGEDELWQMAIRERSARQQADAIAAASASSPPLDRRSSPFYNSNNERPRTASAPTTATPTSLNTSSNQSQSHRRTSGSRTNTAANGVNGVNGVNGNDGNGSPTTRGMTSWGSSGRLNSPSRTLSSLLSRNRTRSPERAIPLAPFQFGTPLTLAPVSLTPPAFTMEDDDTLRPTALEDLYVTRKESLPHSLLELLYRPQYVPHWLPVSLPPTLLARLPPYTNIGDQLQMEMDNINKNNNGNTNDMDSSINMSINGDTKDASFSQSSPSLSHFNNNILPTRDIANRSLMARSSSTPLIRRTHNNGNNNNNNDNDNIDAHGNGNSSNKNRHTHNNGLSYDMQTSIHYRPTEGDRLLMAASRPRLGSGDTPRDHATAKAAAEAKVIAHMRRHEHELRRKRLAGHQQQRVIPQRAILPQSINSAHAAPQLVSGSSSTSISTSTSSSSMTGNGDIAVGPRSIVTTATPASLLYN
jgi:hypothetical protein